SPSAARELRLVPIGFERGALLVAVADPTAAATLESVARMTGLQVVPAVASPQAIARAQRRVYGDLDRPVRPERVAPEVRLARRPTAGERRRYRALADHAGLEFVSLEPDHGSSFDPVTPAAARLLSE